MELSSQSASGVNILYEESFWTSRKRLVINGQDALKIGRKRFQAEVNGELTTFDIRGSFLSGVSVTATKSTPFGDATTGITSLSETTVLARNKWYDWVMICLPLVGIIFGVIFCGAIGGGLSTLLCLLAAVINATIARSELKVGLKVLAQFGVAAVANAIWFGIWYLIALFVVSALV